MLNIYHKKIAPTFLTESSCLSNINSWKLVHEYIFLYVFLKVDILLLLYILINCVNLHETSNIDCNIIDNSYAH